LRRHGRDIRLVRAPKHRLYVRSDHKPTCNALKPEYMDVTSHLRFGSLEEPFRREKMN